MFADRVVQREFPCSASCMMATAVKFLPIEAMLNFVSMVTGDAYSTLAQPRAAR